MNIKWGSFEFNFELESMWLFVLFLVCGFGTLAIAIIYK